MLKFARKIEKKIDTHINLPDDKRVIFCPYNIIIVYKVLNNKGKIKHFSKNLLVNDIKK